MKLNGIEIPDDIEIPELSAETIAEIDTLHETLHREYEEMRRDRLARAHYDARAAAPYVNRPEDSKPVTVSIKTLRRLEPIARAKVLYLLRDQVTA
jgi:hypothetical protein